MGNVYLEKDLEREIILKGEDVSKFVNEAVKNALSAIKEKKVK